jgi:ferrochelatase
VSEPLGPESEPLGVVVMAYGTPASPDDVERYYTDIRRGRPPSPEQLADLERRYEAIGGTFPLRERTEAQRATIQRALDDRAPGRCRVALGQKHSAPFIEDAAAQLADDGLSTIVGLVLAPHWSAPSVGEYQRRLADAAAARGAHAIGIESWHLLPEYVAFLAGAVTDARATLPEDHTVLFTAHSLPERVLQDDPYPDQLRAGAAAVADACGLADPAWTIGWQSAGATPEPWRGPDVVELIGALDTAGVCVCPHGFVADHLEVRYDLDVVAAGAAEAAGLAYARTRVLNDDATVLGALADLVLAAARRVEPA